MGAQKYSKDFLEGVRFAEQTADLVAQAWQQSENPDWHGGVAAAREIVQRLRQVHAPMRVTDTQRATLNLMAKGWSLHSQYEVEEGKERPGGAPSLWPYVTDAGYKSVLATTLAALLRLNLVEEEKRYLSGESMQGDRQWQRWTIVYRLTEQGKTVVSAHEQGDEK